MRHIKVPLALLTLIGLAGCVGYAQPYQAQPAAYAPGQYGQQVALGSTCYAGIYTCPAPGAQPVGAPCSCPGIGAPSFGNVR